MAYTYYYTYHSMYLCIKPVAATKCEISTLLFLGYLQLCDQIEFRL